MDFQQVPSIREEMQLTPIPHTLSSIFPPSSDTHPVVSPQIHATYDIPTIREEMQLTPIPHTLSSLFPPSSGIHSVVSPQICPTYDIPPPIVHCISPAIEHRLAPLNDPGTPPSYEEAIASSGPPPPSYDSLFSTIRDFLKHIIILLFFTVGFIAMLGIRSAIPISMMVIGGLYLYDCPQNEYIPVYLLITGGFIMFQHLLELCLKVRQQVGGEQETRRQSAAEKLMGWVIFVWFILGSIWVYREYEPNYDPLLGKYCNKTLYLFAFWLTTILNIFLGLSTVALCSVSMAAITFQQFGYFG